MLEQCFYHNTNIRSQMRDRGSLPGLSERCLDLLLPTLSRIAVQSYSQVLICTATRHFQTGNGWTLTGPFAVTGRIFAQPILKARPAAFSFLTVVLGPAASTATFKYVSEFIGPVFYCDTWVTSFWNPYSQQRDWHVSMAAFSIDLSIL